jgi:cystathionine beta-lyase/cystathionine gamma-synthase
MDFETRAIHAGRSPTRDRRGDDADLPDVDVRAGGGRRHKGYDYARVANPTRTALEECLASLENAAHGHRVLVGRRRDDDDHAPRRPGDRVVCVNDVYGGTYRMFSQVYEPKGYRFTLRHARLPLNAEPEAHVADARLVWIETRRTRS